MKRQLAGILAIALSLTLALSGCGLLVAVEASRGENLMEGIEGTTITIAPPPEAGLNIKPAADFSVKLFQNGIERGENSLLSPFSVLYALSLTANGAQGETLDQMEATFGMSAEELNVFLYWYSHHLPQGEDYSLHLANAIWLRDTESLNVSRDFLQKNYDYHDAEIYKAPFDNGTKNAINQWVNENTDGMIPYILDEISDEAMMYLVNSLAFDATWASIYYDYEVRDDVFTTEGGSEQPAQLMWSNEFRYLEDELATGFVKYYQDEAYAFVGLLPNEGVSVSDYVASMTGESLLNLLESSTSEEVIVAIPKFESDYGIALDDALATMGMPEAFEPVSAQFDAMAQSEEGPLFISNILHKTFISVDEEGTRAAASTMVEMVASTEEPEDEPEPKEVILNRPFVYMIIDCNTNLPLFIGTTMTLA